MRAVEISDLVVIVTGSSAGIGRATAELLVERAAAVAAVDIDPVTPPQGALALECDVRDDQSVGDAIQAALAAFGRIDALVNNAAVAGVPGTIEDADLASWRSAWETNVLGPVRMTRAVLPHLRRSAHAVVVNTCSVVCEFGLPGMALYATTKGALKALTLATAADLLADGIRVVGVSPGSTATRNSSGRTDWMPIGRLLEPREVAVTTAALLVASGTTGVIWTVAGGMGTVDVR